jgi:hypothetical protein
MQCPVSAGSRRLSLLHAYDTLNVTPENIVRWAMVLRTANVGISVFVLMRYETGLDVRFGDLNGWLSFETSQGRFVMLRGMRSVGPCRMKLFQNRLE